MRPPTTGYKSLDDVGKFNMIWNVSLVLIPIFLILFVIHIFFQDDSWPTSLAAFVVAVLNIIVLGARRKFKLVGTWTVVLGVLICQASIFIIQDSHVVSDTMWCILVAFFTFFLFGVWMGTTILLLNLSGLLVFLLNGSSHDILKKGIKFETIDIQLVVNVIYVALALAFVIHKMMDNNKRINERFEKQMKDNEILLKEIHHRVKNNLQIVSSLLRLQAIESTDERVEEQFNEAISRIRSMALIHEKMYNNKDLSKIDIESYLVMLAKDIVESIRSDCNIEFNVSSKMGEIDIKSVVPISLIFNELITNSIKHGFQEMKNGRIDVHIIDDNENLIFTYLDDGKWKAPDTEGTFGVELISTLTEQLEGEYKRDLSNGTKYTFEFKSDLFLFNR